MAMLTLTLTEAQYREARDLRDSYPDTFGRHVDSGDAVYVGERRELVIFTDDAARDFAWSAGSALDIVLDNRASGCAIREDAARGRVLANLLAKLREHGVRDSQADARQDAVVTPLTDNDGTTPDAAEREAARRELSSRHVPDAVLVDVDGDIYAVASLVPDDGDPCDCGTVLGERGAYVTHAAGGHPLCTGMGTENDYGVTLTVAQARTVDALHEHDATSNRTPIDAYVALLDDDKVTPTAVLVLRADGDAPNRAVRVWHRDGERAPIDVDGTANSYARAMEAMADSRVVQREDDSVFTITPGGEYRHARADVAAIAWQWRERESRRELPASRGAYGVDVDAIAARLAREAADAFTLTGDAEDDSRRASDIARDLPAGERVSFAARVLVATLTADAVSGQGATAARILRTAARAGWLRPDERAILAPFASALDALRED